MHDENNICSPQYGEVIRTYLQESLRIASYKIPNNTLQSSFALQVVAGGMQESVDMEDFFVNSRNGGIMGIPTRTGLYNMTLKVIIVCWLGIQYSNSLAT